MKMSVSHLVDGVCLNTGHCGLLSLEETRMAKLIKKEPISTVYDVENVPFARGRFASVKKCTHKKTGVDYAAKFIRKRRRASDQKHDILHEVSVLQLTKSTDSIVRLYEVYETASEMALILELAVGGELQKVLDLEEALQEEYAVKYLKQILEGLRFLHERNIAHLDLKPQNILLTGEYPDCDIKLCDFGISRVVQEGVEVREILGTPDYVAPEILNYEPIGLATDIWSVGVLAYVLVTGYSPFAGNTKQETFCNISQCNLTFPEELFEEVSENAKHFIRSTLVCKPSLRLTVDQCLAHPWISSHLSTSIDVKISTFSDEPKTNGIHDNHNTSDAIEDKSNDVSIVKEVHLSQGDDDNDGDDISDSLYKKDVNGRADSESGDELPMYKRPRNCCDENHSAIAVDPRWPDIRCCDKDNVQEVPEYGKSIDTSFTASPVTLLLDRSLIY